MNIEVLETLPALRSFQPDWLRLWDLCPRATPFQSPQWLLPWVTHLFGGGQIRALAICDASDLVGFAPFFIWGNETRTVSFLGAGISDYGDLLFAPGYEQACVRAVRDFLESSRDQWDVLDLQELRAGSGLLEAWPAQECSVCPVLDLATFPGSMDHKHRTDVRRARNKLSKSDLSFTTANDLDAFFRLHEARWGALDQPLRRFHCDVAQAFVEAGQLRLSLLQVANAPAAAIYAFTTRKTLYCYLSAFDPAMAKLSPGAVLLGWVIDQAITEGANEVDFLRDPEAYKYLWGARDRKNYAVKI